jgi:hypothetical protein
MRIIKNTLSDMGLRHFMETFMEEIFGAKKPEERLRKVIVRDFEISKWCGWAGGVRGVEDFECVAILANHARGVWDIQTTGTRSRRAEKRHKSLFSQKSGIGSGSTLLFLGIVGPFQFEDFHQIRRECGVWVTLVFCGKS